jgi:MFS family permease
MTDASLFATPAERPIAARTVIVALLPIMAVVFVAFLVVGFALPVLPLHVHRDLGLGTFVVGLVAGSQFAASFVSRPSAGQYADSRGARRAIVVGLLMAAASGLFYLASLAFVHAPVPSITILIAGRALLGGGESFVMTGALSLGLALAGPRNTGRVIAWVGTAMFGAFALGAPLGTALYAAYGFPAIAAMTALAPLATLLVVLLLKPVAPTLRGRAAFGKVFGAVWLPGLGMALGSIGFGAMIAFVTLLFAERGWNPAWPALTLFALAFIAMRSLFGHLPDRLGGARVVLASVIVEALGLSMLGLTTSAAVALVGATLVGAGYSLIYPGFGVEAVRRAPPESRGLAMGAYTAFIDLALGITAPALGLISGWAGLSTVFLASAGATLVAAAIALRFLQASPGSQGCSHAIRPGRWR